MRIGLDTNIIIYAFDNTEKRKHEIAVEIIKKLLEKPEKYAIAAQVLAEGLYVIIKRKYPAAEETYVRFVDTLQLLAPLKTPSYTAETIILASKHKNFWDALLAYTYIQNGVERILTENIDDFKDIPIRAEDPFSR